MTVHSRHSSHHKGRKLTARQKAALAAGRAKARKLHPHPVHKAGHRVKKH